MEKGIENEGFSTQVIIATLNEEKRIGLTIAELKDYLGPVSDALASSEAEGPVLF